LKNMKTQNMILVGGIVLIIFAVVVLAISYYQGMENTEIINVGAGEYEEYSLNLEDGKYIVLLTSDENFSYEVLDSKGNVLYRESNVTSAEISLNHGGTYTIKIENMGDKKISVAITAGREEIMNNMALLTYLSGGICSIGMIVIVIGIALILWNRKKEEKIYSRY